MIVLGLDVGSREIGIALVSVPDGARAAVAREKARLLDRAKLELGPTLALIEAVADSLDLVAIEPPVVSTQASCGNAGPLRPWACPRTRRRAQSSRGTCGDTRRRWGCAWSRCQRQSGGSGSQGARTRAMRTSSGRSGCGWRGPGGRTQTSEMRRGVRCGRR